MITGASGFIGSAVARRLVEIGHEVWGLSSYGSAPKGVTHLAVDLRDARAVFVAMEAAQPEIVLHLGARTEVATSFDSPNDFFHVNACGTVALAEAAVAFPVRLFVLASSMEVYGWQPAPWAPFDEDTRPAPNAPYAVAKLAAEYYLQYLGRTVNLPWCVLRQTNTYGRTASDFFVVERILSQMMEGGTVRLGDPRPIRNFLYIDDLVDLYQAIIEKPEAVASSTFCTGPDNALTIRDLAALCAEVTGWRGPVLQWDTLPPRPGEVHYLNSVARKITACLGWAPTVDLREGLIRTIRARGGRT